MSVYIRENGEVVIQEKTKMEKINQYFGKIKNDNSVLMSELKTYLSIYKTGHINRIIDSLKKYNQFDDNEYRKITEMYFMIARQLKDMNEDVLAIYRHHQVNGII